MIWNPDENNAGGTDQQSADPNQPTEREPEMIESGSAEGASTSEGATTATPVPTEERRPRRRGRSGLG